MWAFILASLLIELTPGPNMTWLAVLGATHGRRTALVAVAGIALGLSFAGLVAALGLAALLDLFPSLNTALRIAGTFYLLYLAYDAWVDASQTESRGQTREAVFMQGLVSNVLNPKAYLFYAAVLPQFLSGPYHSATELASLTIVYVAVATTVHAAIALLSGNFASWLKRSRQAVIVRRFMALTIGLAAVWFFYSAEHLTH